MIHSSRLSWLVAACAIGGCDGTEFTARDASSVDGTSDTAIDGATCVAAPSGLVARWRAEMDATEQLGTYPGVVTGGVGYTTGRHGSAFLLDGQDDAVLVQDNEAMWALGSQSVEAWVRTTYTGSQTIIGKYECGNQCPAASFSYWNVRLIDGYLGYYTRPQSIDTIKLVVANVEPIADGGWHHVVAVRDVANAQLVLYLDGTLAASLALASPDLAAQGNTDGEADLVTIGALANAGVPGYGDHFRGAIDDVAYYATALTAAEVAAIYGARDGACP
jgi:hypothetical protein